MKPRTHWIIPVSIVLTVLGSYFTVQAVGENPLIVLLMGIISGGVMWLALKYVQREHVRHPETYFGASRIGLKSLVIGGLVVANLLMQRFVHAALHHG